MAGWVFLRLLWIRREENFKNFTQITQIKNNQKQQPLNYFGFHNQLTIIKIQTLLKCLLHNVEPLKKISAPKSFGSCQAEESVLSLSGGGGRSFFF